jgi:DNA-binding PadR family transcriptional regulator
MSEIGLLRLVGCYPHPVALARRLAPGELMPLLCRLERSGLVTRRRGLYRITARGRNELETQRRLVGSLLNARSCAEG